MQPVPIWPHPDIMCIGGWSAPAGPSIRSPLTGHSDASVDWANTRAINGMVDLAVYGHDDWFEVGNLDLSIAHDGATTWLELTEFWAVRFGVDESQARPIIAAMEETPDNPLPEDPDYLMWANKTAITLSALTSEFLFR